MKTAELTGPLLDYWVARAEGVPAADLELRGVQRTDNHICVKHLRGFIGGTSAVMVLDYSTNWALTGLLIEKYSVDLDRIDGQWYALACVGARVRQAVADLPAPAICRAVVHAAFGAEVGDLPE